MTNVRARKGYASLLALAGAVAAVAAPPAYAQSAAVQRAALKVFQDYAVDGRIDPCKHTSQELKLVQDNIPPDIEQYASDYPAAVGAALEARARGDCNGTKPQAAPVVPATVAPTPQPTPVPTAVPMKRVVPAPPQPETAPVSATATAAASRPARDVVLERVATATPAADAPAPLFLLGILTALLAATALLMVAMTRFGVGDERLAGARHAWREASWRTSGGFAEFRDWLRLGR